MTGSLGKLVTRNLGHLNIGCCCNMGAACQNIPIPEIESERNERKTVRESIKGKGKNCEATKKGKWRAKRGEEIATETNT